MAELLLLIVCFILASGFFAMIDAAVLSVTHAEVEVMLSKKSFGAKDLKQILRHTTRAIIVIVILTNITNILGPILVGRKAEILFGSSAIGYVTAVLTFATIIFSEIIPKSIGAHYAPGIARTIAPALRLLILVLSPVVIGLERFTRLFKSGSRKVGTEAQIRALAKLGGKEGHIDSDELRLIHRAFILNDRTTKDIMSPVEAMVSIRETDTIRKAAKVVFEHSYSRYPVIGKSKDQIVGYALSRDILEAMADDKQSEPITPLLREVPFVEATLRCDDLLNVLRANESHLAIVRDKDTTVGLVTLEDALEELVGEIEDEGDKEA